MRLLASSLTALAAAASSHAAIIHRWSFNEASGAVPHNTVLTDTVGGTQMRVVGAGATRDGTALTLPGTSTGDAAPSTISAYLDLPNGILSSRTALSLEFWVTPLSNRNWQRLFDFGRMNRTGMGTGAAVGEIRPDATTSTGSTQAIDNFFLSLNRGTSANTQMLEGRNDNASPQQLSTSVSLGTGTRRHIVATFETVGAGTVARWYADGVLVGTLNAPYPMSSIDDVNNWIGRSQWSGDAVSNLRLDEVRIYDHVLSAAEVTASGTAGPNASIPPPTAANDAVTLHPNGKALIPVLGNDSGPIIPSSVVIVTHPLNGTASVASDGRILYVNTSSASADAFTYRVSGAGGTSNAATVSLAFADQLRVPGIQHNVPSTPPSTTLALVDAFPGLTFNQPLAIASPPGETSRVFVAQKGGLLRVVTGITSTPAVSTFLDLPGLLATRGESLATSSECGLLGIAFHPNYATNGQFFVFYSVSIGGLLHQRVSRFTATSPSANTANAGSELVLIQQRDEADNHNGGDLHFGPDGYLYISTGDEGGQNDQYGNAQRLNGDFFCAILRIDVDRRPGNLEPNTHAAVPRDGGVARYSIPADNPFVGLTFPVGQPLVRSEIWAHGFRNPWRMAFDRVTGELWVGDVGGSQREEVNLAVAGGNYGWAFREGFTTGPRTNPPVGFTSINPLYDYTRGNGSNQGYSITGGIVATGNRFAALTDAYIFADYVSGNIWSLRRTAGAPVVSRLLGEGGVAGFGRDPSNNDVLLANLGIGQIRRLVSTTVSTSFPQTLSATGLFADLSDLSPQPGLVPYTINLPFWSDHGVKRRWFTLPGMTGRFTWNREGPWGYPAGTIWVKHFDMEMTRGNPATARRIETRLLVRNATGAYGVSYRWNEAQTEATLVADEGENVPLSVVVNGVAMPQNWNIPSRANCMSCHTSQAGFSLSFKTRQLNRDATLLAYVGNQVELLREAGYLANEPGPTEVLPRHARLDENHLPLAARARSYLEVNCGYCHMPGGTAPGSWDGREIATLAQTGLIDGPVSNNGGNPANRLIVSGSPIHSVLLQRVAASNGFTRMPPIASNVVDQQAVELLEGWIREELSARRDYPAWRAERFPPSSPYTGEPSEDADGDGADNQMEYLFGTDPLSALARPVKDVTVSMDSVQVTVNVPAGRRALVETSSDLVTWSPWAVAGNDGTVTAPGSRTFAAPFTGATQFFRVTLAED